VCATYMQVTRTFFRFKKKMTLFNQNLPRSIIAGDTRTFSVSASDLTSAGGYTMYYILTGTTRIKITGVANGDSWEFSIAASKTSNWKEQVATYAVYATKGAERKSVARGSIQIYGNPDQPDYGSEIRQLQVDMDNIAAMKSKLAKDPKITMSFNGQSFTRANIDDLFALETSIAKRLYQMRFGHTNVRKTIRGVFGR